MGKEKGGTSCLRSILQAFPIVVGGFSLSVQPRTTICLPIISPVVQISFVSIFSDVRRIPQSELGDFTSSKRPKESGPFTAEKRLNSTAEPIAITYTHTRSTGHASALSSALPGLHCCQLWAHITARTQTRSDRSSWSSPSLWIRGLDRHIPGTFYMHGGAGDCRSAWR